MIRGCHRPRFRPKRFTSLPAQTNKTLTIMTFLFSYLALVRVPEQCYQGALLASTHRPSPRTLPAAMIVEPPDTHRDSPPLEPTCPALTHSSGVPRLLESSLNASPRVILPRLLSPFRRKPAPSTIIIDLETSSEPASPRIRKFSWSDNNSPLPPACVPGTSLLLPALSCPPPPKQIRGNLLVLFLRQCHPPWPPPPPSPKPLVSLIITCTGRQARVRCACRCRLHKADGSHLLACGLGRAGRLVLGRKWRFTETQPGCHLTTSPGRPPVGQSLSLSLCIIFRTQIAG